MFGQDNVRKINTIPFPNNTVSRIIKDMSDNIEEMVGLIQQLKNSKFFPIQIDESTDVAGLSILLVTACLLYTSRCV